MKRPTATNFFERRESARKRTWLLGVLFILGVVAVALLAWSVCVGCCALCVYGGAMRAVLFEGDLEAIRSLEESGDFFYGVVQISEGRGSAAFVVGGAIDVGTPYKICEQKRRGVSGVAEKLGGTRIDRSATDLNEKRFYNVVEEMALAAGVPVPAVYVLRDEDGINACALGGKPEKSAVSKKARRSR